MLWIGRDLTQRLRPRPEQDIVDDGLVLEGDDLDLLGHREHDVEVGHVEQFGLTVREPLGARETLALWATFCGTSCKRRVDGHNRRTPRRDRQERRCGNSRSRSWRAAARWTATRHSDHGKRGRSGGTRPPPPALRGPRTSRQAGTRSGTVGTSTSSDSSGLAVAQTLLAAIMRYRAVVLRLRWPSSSWIVRRSVPASSR